MTGQNDWHGWRVSPKCLQGGYLKMTMFNRFDLNRTLFMTLCALFVLACAQPFTLAAQNGAKPFSRLLEFAESGKLDAPYHAFEEFENSYNPQIHATNMDYLKSHPDLMEQIRTDLGAQTIKWRLKNLSHRQLYVSETRTEYIQLYEAYCKEAISEVLEALELPNPYARIITLSEEGRDSVDSEGIDALIVNDLVQEYLAKYEFRSETDKAVAIELKGTYSTGEIGSYSSELVFGENGKVDFIHYPYTIWKNQAENPYTLLMTPVEETIHILLRPYTESAIKRSIESLESCSRDRAEEIVEGWIGIEEAIVGGLVNSLLPPILENQVGEIPGDLISRDIETKNKIDKYCYLQQGIRVVRSLGYKASLALYKEDPAAFEALL